jgi:predicted ATP-binding protein involved in virulence
MKKEDGNIKIIMEISGGNKMYIKNIKISGIGGIRNLQLNFNEGLNVICGANGIGKTTILNIIADAFGNNQRILKKNSQCEQGEYDIDFLNQEGNLNSINNQILVFEPDSNEWIGNAKEESRYVLTFGINRTIEYVRLGAIPMDVKRDIFNIAEVVRNGIGADSIKGWFVNRFVFHDKEKSMSEEQKENFELAKSAFSILDSGMEFETVKSGSLDIVLKTPKGNIYFEYLSAGYKTCMYIILGIIEELEFRFTEPYICASDFNGVILIDEIELHLHPVWQAKLVLSLKKIFPNAQMILTTHSPSILQVLEKNEIIPLYEDDNGEVSVKELHLGEYGLQGWSLEEILKDVMGMPSTTSELYKSTLKLFDLAMDNEDLLEIEKNFEILDKMLHPNSTLRKLLQIQKAGMEV